jgi:hypothetical protein
VYGAFDSNECPAGSARIETATGCRAAADAAGRGYSPTSLNVGHMPRGCHVTSIAVVLNVHATGGPDPTARLLCYTGTAVFTPAPTGEPLRSRLRSSLTRWCCARALDTLILLCPGVPTELPTATGAHRVISLYGVPKSLLFG